MSILGIILCLVFLILWMIIQAYGIINVAMNEVKEPSTRFKIIAYSLALGAAAFLCGLFIGL